MLVAIFVEVVLVVIFCGGIGGVVVDVGVLVYIGSGVDIIDVGGCGDGAGVVRGG